MESTESSPVDPFKSKEILHSRSKQLPSDQMAKGLEQSPWSSKTPEKLVNPPRRVQNRRPILSVKEVREEAKRLRQSDPDPSDNQPNQVRSAKEQLAQWPSEALVTKSEKAGESTKLPEKYEILDKFFNSLDSSIRLTRLKGSMSTMANICPKIESLSDRRFSYNHLAQLKFILPEAIEVKKILMHDEGTNCMKPDLHVTLNVNAIEDKRKQKSGSANSQLRKVFRARLVDFFKSHPEEDEVPEETLPQPFNRSSQDLHADTIKASSSSLVETDMHSRQQPADASHLPQSFRSHFSRKILKHEPVDATQEPSIKSLQPCAVLVSQLHVDQSSLKLETSASTVPFPVKFSSKPTISENCLVHGASPASLPPSQSPATPIKKMDSTNEDYSSTRTATFEGTPAKLALTPAKLMSATPALQPPKRCCMSPDDPKSPEKLIRRQPPSRSLKFDTPVKNANMEDEYGESDRLLVDSDIFEILPENLLQSITEKEKKALEEKDPAISEAKWRRQMIASLPKLFDMIHFLFQSIKRSVITKEELTYRIIASQMDMVDRREVEEQLRLLQELVPEWIYEKSASSGDLLLCINKISSPESIRARLAEAI